ncbi:spermatogenesis-associated protein 17-like [Convolutriloba macropyga]|uniref:spermatogenesis-associated protein 17-like n=1 Tax=Convolutriloba macropyga TaxID=536237 RepID=UPI003F51E7AC
MAAFIKLQDENRLFNSDVFENHKDAESYRELEFRAAIAIQSWYRGLRTRHYLRHLNKCAVIVQRTWRGYLGRHFCRDKLDAAVKRMMLDFYNDKAIKIQKRWRGFYVRKYKHNFYARKRYLELVEKKNAMVREQLEEYNQQAKQEMMRNMQEMRAKKIEEEARKNHFLLSTAQIPGVYNSPYRIYPHEMEFHMRSAKFNDTAKENNGTAAAKWKGGKAGGTVGSTGSGGARKKLPRSNSNSQEANFSVGKGSKSESDSVLPPITKLQGPFRNPKEVYAQKNKALKPTLRVQTDFFSLEEAQKELKLEEWRERIVDETWQPFTQFRYPYKRLMHSASDYGHLKDDYLREDHPESRVTENDFKRVNSPVPIFEKLGSTYTKGAGAIC